MMLFIGGMCFMQFFISYESGDYGNAALSLAVSTAAIFGRWIFRAER